VFWQNRNTYFDANYYFNNINGQARDIINLNQFGGHIGGPVKKNKLFFFANFESYKLPSTYNFTRQVLTPDALNGNFTCKGSDNHPNEFHDGLDGGTVLFRDTINDALFSAWRGYNPSFAGGYVAGATSVSTPQRRNSRTKSFTDNVSWSKGAHQLSFSGNFEQVNLFQSGQRKQHYFGLRVLITDRAEWTTAQIIEAYRGQSKVESAFRDLKDPRMLATRPQFHWTDHKLHVHAFICVMAYLLVTLLHRRAKHKTAFDGSPRRLLVELAELRCCRSIDMTGRKGRPRVRIQIEEATPELRALGETLNAIPELR
jgi:hypothetical protein